MTSVAIRRDRATTLSVEGRRLRLTSPDKILYPATGTTKSDVVAYWQAVAPRLLPHVADRPVTRKRWVHGVGTPDDPGEVFFEKNLPSGVPEWVRRVTVRHRSHSNDYPVADGAATLAWFGQVGALELHVPQWRVDPSGAPQNPDRFVLDLDPGPGLDLHACLDVAHVARELLAGMGLELWPVTSGSKGLHLYAGLDGTRDADTINQFARGVAEALHDELPDLVVTSMRKASREGRVLVDWSQNNRSKTTIAPYSLRGRFEPFVAAPRTWDDLEDDPRHLRLEEVLERTGDPLSPLAREPLSGPGDRLATYRSMRDAASTPEPVAVAPVTDRGDDERIFVIQEHHAKRLHWDVRIEHDGVLASWAVPKGPPVDPSENRLAIRTEDHPLEYATFAGTIPKGQYGAGEMSVWDTGPCTIRTWEDDHVVATLHGRADGGGLEGEATFAFVRTGENWLMHRMRSPDGGQVARTTTRDEVVAPMLAVRADRARLPGPDSDWLLELKWDGVRVLASCDGDDVTLTGRRGSDMTATFPEIAAALRTLRLDDTVLDGEVVALVPSDPRPVVSFAHLQERLGLTTQADIDRARLRTPVHYVAFDVLRVEGTSATRLPLDRRRELLTALSVGDAKAVSQSEVLDTDLADALALSREHGLEGVLAKRRSSRYRPGARSDDWRKFKHEHSAEVVVVGWRPGRGDRADGLGSLLVAVRDPGSAELRYAGRVGTGFGQRDLTALRRELRTLERATPPIDVPDEPARDAVWVQAHLVGEVTFAGQTRNGLLRHPVWRGRRHDKAVDDLQPPDDWTPMEGAS